MPKKKVSKTTIIVILILVVSIVSVAGIAWHDGKIGVTPLVSINDLTVPGGTVVRVRGTITGIASGVSILINDGTGAVTVPWTETAALAYYSIVVIRATVNSAHTLRDTVFVQPVWLFA